MDATHNKPPSLGRGCCVIPTQEMGKPSQRGEGHTRVAFLNPKHHPAAPAGPFRCSAWGHTHTHESYWGPPTQLLSAVLRTLSSQGASSSVPSPLCPQCLARRAPRMSGMRQRVSPAPPDHCKGTSVPTRDPQGHRPGTRAYATSVCPAETQQPTGQAHTQGPP